MKSMTRRLLGHCASIPPINPLNMLPVVIMLGVWLVLRAQGVPVDPAFVVSVVAAQAYLVWRNLPMTAANLDVVGTPSRRLLHLVVGVTFLIALLQLWLGSPLFTQRMLTVLCVFFLVVMVLGIFKERDMLDRVRPALPANESYTPPVSLLRVNATMAALIIAVNEWLIYYESPAIWITVVPLFMLVLHGIYWILVQMTMSYHETRFDQGKPA